MSKQLSLIGSGIKIIAHLTKEAEAHIKKADIVLYLVNEPVMSSWICNQAKKALDLSGLYFSKQDRIDSYQLIIQEIFSVLEQNDFVCIVFYGHPTVYAYPGLEAIKQAKNIGIQTKILPAISAEDCLLADLGIDPGSCGCYSVEATDLLIYQRQPEISSHLIIWQVGILGNLGHQEKVNSKALKHFVKYLLEIYSANHMVTLYEASIYPGVECKIVQFPLKEFCNQNLSKISTLYIPPEKKKKADPLILKKLGL